jgi:hypothetical protein
MITSTRSLADERTTVSLEDCIDCRGNNIRRVAHSKPGFGLTGDVQISPTLSSRHRKAMICGVEGPCVATSTGCEERWGSSRSGRRENANERGDTLSSCRTAPLKPKPGLNGPRPEDSSRIRKDSGAGPPLRSLKMSPYFRSGWHIERYGSRGSGEVEIRKPNGGGFPAERNSPSVLVSEYPLHIASRWLRI